ncbi:MAG: hypothetical protein IJX83_01260 [Lachnospiraceae bacterium]|nr:hypothetical protein [Lachnospiraceae bacterium]
MNENKFRKRKAYFVFVMKVIFGVSFIAAIWIMSHHMGLSEDLDFGAGAYYYADIPGFEKWFNSTPFASTVSSALIFLLFLVWGTLMMKLWLWIDRKVSNDGSGET